MPPVSFRKVLPLLARAALLLAGVLTAGAAPWPHEAGDVPPDPAIHWGRLENGLRFAIRHNTEPAGRVYLILQVAAGSLNERDDQRGYAHFVEHMMFRGTRKYPANSLVSLLQREGLSFGADTSAFTNYTTTFYNLDLPRNSPEKIDLGLSILRDFADGAVIARAEVKREAKVIESERRTRESTASRVGDLVNEFLYPGAILNQRSPIGSPESVANATAEGLAEFYHAWYQPSRLTLIAVGDVDPADMEKYIRQHFANLAPAAPATLREANPGFQAVPADVQGRFIPNPTPGGTANQLFALTPVPPQPDTVARRRAQLAASAGFGILNARLVEIARQRASEIGEAEAGWSDEFGTMRRAYIRVDTRADLWRAGVRVAEQELRRVLLHGFTADEVRLQIQAYENALRESLRTAPTRASAQLAHAIRLGLELDRVVTAPETDLELALPAITALTPESCLAAFKDMWATPNRRLAVIGYYPAALTDADVRTAYDDSAYANFFSGKDPREIEPFDYTTFGEPGKITRRTHDERVDVESLAFANGVRANLKATDYEKDRVYVRLRLGRGLLTEPADKPGLGLVTDGCFLAGGLGHYDNVELGRRLAGDTLSFNFSVEEDGFYFTGFSSPDKLEKLLQVITAFLTDPAFRPEAFQGTIARLQSHYPTVNREPTQFLRALCPTVLAGGDLRYGLVPPDKVMQRQQGEVEAWLKPALARAPIEVGIAGDLNLAATLEALTRTVGALPARDPAPAPDASRRPVLPTQSIQQTWLVDGGDPAKAAVRIYWPGVDDDDFRTSRRLQVLGEVLNDRLRVKIREELGATYGPLTDVWGSSVWPGYGYLCVEIETAPAMAERVANLTRRIAADIVAKGITEDEFQRVIEPRLASLKQELRNNNYWTYHVLSRLQTNPGRVSWPLTRNSDYQTMLRKEVEEVARRYLGSGRFYTFIARAK